MTYKQLLAVGKDIHTLRGINYLLAWDQETYLPHGAAASRAMHLQMAAAMLHKLETSKKFVLKLQKLIDLSTGQILDESLGDPQRAALREWRRHYLLISKLPPKFVQTFAKLTSEAMHVWAQAKKTDAFHKFAPFLEKIIVMSRQKADYLGYKEHPYDALLDEYEPQMTTAKIQEIFGHIKEPIIKLLDKIKQKRPPDLSFLKHEVSNERQMRAGIAILKEMGYDFNHGRLDISAHPFSTSIHPTDSRVTTRLDPTNFMSNIGVCLHEGGHALYELGLPIEHYGSPLCEAASTSVHESQSRFWETRIGQSLPFCKAYFPLFKEAFAPALDSVTEEELYKAINHVEPSFIRVDADEVTYSLHIILRFEMEKALIEGSLQLRDIPDAWNEKMRSYLGISPPTNREGCLQDVHWSMGGFGYFPSYTLGNLYAAQLFEAFELDHSNWKERVEGRDLAFIREWQRNKIHQHGKRYIPLELIEKASGKAFSPKPYLRYLHSKYD